MGLELFMRAKTLKVIWWWRRWWWGWWWGGGGRGGGGEARLIIPRMRNVWDESCRENQNTFYIQWLILKIMPFMR